MSVNVPVNEKIKEQDINNKLQLYGIYSAFANGKVPSVSSSMAAQRVRTEHTTSTGFKLPSENYHRATFSLWL